MALITIREAAKRLAVIDRAVWKWTLTDRFAPELIRLGRAVRVRESELMDWIAAGCPCKDQWRLQRLAQGQPDSLRAMKDQPNASRVRNSRRSD